MRSLLVVLLIARLLPAAGYAADVDAAAATPAPAGTPIHPEPWNLVANGEFDGGALLPDRWSIRPEPLPVDILMFRDQGVHISVAGYGGARASAAIDKLEASAVPARWRQEGIKVRAGAGLVLMAFARREGGIAAPSITLEFEAADGRALSDETYVFPSGKQWTRLNERVRVPADPAAVAIELIAGKGKGKTWFDRIALVEFDEEAETLARERWHNWRKARHRFPTAGWSFFDLIDYGPKETEYRDYADAGLSLIKLPVREESYRRAMQAGLEPLLLNADTDFPTPTAPEVAGYWLKDEPKNRREMVALGNTARRIYREDRRGAIPMVNQWGGNMLDEVVALQYPAYIQMTCYDLMANGSTMSRHYNLLEHIRNTVLANNMDFMGWALITKHSSRNTHFRQASESDVFWQVYSALAYGAKGIWYYRYFDKYFSNTHPVEGDGDKAPTVTRDYIKAVNAELHALWPVAKHLRSTGVFHAHAEAYPTTIVGACKLDGEWVISLYRDGDVSVIETFRGDKFLLGVFENMDDPADQATYLMVQNKRHAMATRKSDPALSGTATFRASAGVAAVDRFDVKSAEWVPVSEDGKSFRLTMDGGQGVLLRLRKRIGK